MASKPSAVLKLNGKPFNLNPPSPTAARIKAFLDKQPADELFTGEELASRAGARSVLQGKVSNLEELAGYGLKVGRVKYWGNPKAIATLREQVGQ